MSRPLPTSRRPRPRPPPSPADRFRAMLRRREAELSAELRDYGDGDDADPPRPLPAAEVVAIFEEVLSDLTFNSKPMIGDLTAIAAEQRACARGIAAAVCDRILKVPVDQKLPSLYLLDSIVKNVGREYVIHFAAYLPKVFCEAYNQVDPSLYSAMHHLLKTWSKVFHPSVLRNIEDELKFSAPLNQRSTGLADMRYSESPSPGPSHGIHVNPKYLERRLVGSSSGEDTINIEGDRVETLERNTSESPERWSGASPQFHDVRHMKGAASSLQVYGQKSCIQFGDYDFDPFESLSSGREILRASSPQTAAMRTSPMVGLERALPCLKRRRSRSPPRIGLRRSESPVVDRFGQGGRVDRVSPSHSGQGFGHDRVHDQNGWVDKRCPSENGAQPRENSTGYHRNNRYAKQRSRDLIDAYGNHRETSHLYEKRPKVQHLDVIGSNSNTNTRNWQSSEEEEYIWEDMSPTLASHSNRKSVQPFRPLNEKPGSSRPGDMIFKSDSRRSDWEDQASLQSLVDEDKIVGLHYGQRTMDKYLDGAESQNEELLEYKSSHHLQESRNPYSFLHNAQKIRNPDSQTRGHQFPYSVSGTKPTIGQKRPAPYDNLPDAEAPFRRLSGIDSGNSNVYIPAMKKHREERLYSPPHSAPAIRSPVQKSQPLPTVAIHPNQKKINIRCEPIEGNKPEINRGSNSSSVLPWQQYDAAAKKPTFLKEPFQSSYQGPGSIHVRPQKPEPSSRSQSHDAHGSFHPPPQSRGSTYLVSQPSRHLQTQGRDVVKGSDFSNSLLGAPSSAGMLNMSDTVFHVHGGVLPPLPPGSHPSSSQTGPASQNISSIISSDLFNNLVAQGLISLKPPVQSEGFIGLEFNSELLKARHEPTVNALYIDLPRQCTTCGLRFRCQEEHSSHMDWHVTKNRISKNRKQKPSRNWFVSVKEWLSGAEVLGTDVTPGFLPTEAATENKSDKEMAVRADENQNTCALCGELFEDFYSDETEEWMYKHAVYLNAPHGNIEGLDSSRWGPIVHDKCRPESVEDTGLS